MVRHQKMQQSGDNDIENGDGISHRERRWTKT